jgi:hypothetical protein
MRIAFFVAVLVVTAVIRNPVHEWPFNRHRPEEREQRRDRLGRLETPVGEVSVISHRDPEHGEKVHAPKHGQVRPAQRNAPEKNDRDHERGERDKDETEIHDSSNEQMVPQRPRSNIR